MRTVPDIYFKQECSFLNIKQLHICGLPPSFPYLNAGLLVGSHCASRRSSYCSYVWRFSLASSVREQVLRLFPKSTLHCML